MPPWARAPATSYWPATRSPAASLAAKSKRAPQLGQKPAVRPGRSPWLRPTGLSQRVQNRRLSGTLGSAITTVAGSMVATGLISMMPAPTRLRRLVLPLPVCALRVVRRDTSTRPEVRPVSPGRAAGDDTVSLPDVLLGARPQVSQ
jgi:hypothetical protein